MPISQIKRRMRRLARRARSWSTIVRLTLAGNKIEKNSRLKRCRNPVLMIYGFGATRRTLAILENRLRQDGYTSFSLNLGGFLGTFNTASIEETARHIDTKIERLYRKYKIQGRLTVIGHSKGGLIGQYYVKFLGGTRRVKTFISLGTPHNGNPWALLAIFSPIGLALKSIRQMTPMSRFIKKLKQKKFPSHIQVFSIYSKDDIMCPFPCGVLDEAPNVHNIEVYGVSHSELLIKKNVYNAIKHALRDEMPESWLNASRENYREHVDKKARFRLIK